MTLKAAGVLGVLVAVATATAAEESWITKVLRVAGITASPARLRGAGSDAVIGNIWIIGVDGADARQLTSDGRYQSPVFAPDDQSLYALRDDVLVRVPTGGGASSHVMGLPKAAKLIGFGRDVDELLVLLDDASQPIAEISLAAKATKVVPGDVRTDSAVAVLDDIRGQDRTYGETSLLVRPQRRRGSNEAIEWTEIFVQRDHDAPHQITSCDGRNCGQPVLSSTGRRVAYVREEGP